MSLRCLRCGADSSWIDGNKRSDESEVRKQNDALMARVARLEEAAVALVDRLSKDKTCGACGDSWGHLGNCEADALRSALKEMP